MANKVTFTMNNVPAGLDSMYVRVEEDALTAGVRNVLHSGVQAVTGSAIDINIGENGTVGNGAIISADNYTSGGAAFKSMTGYALIEAGDAPPTPTYLLSGERLKVVPFGDSITDNGDSPANPSYSKSTQGYWVNAAISSTQEFEFLQGLGITGNTTQDLIDRITEATTSGAQIVMLLIGTNDINQGVTVDDIETNMSSILSSLIGAGKKVLLCPVPYRQSSDGFNTTIDELNTRYAALAASLPNDVVFSTSSAEFNAKVSDPLTELEVTGDGLHPNSYGAWLLGKEVAVTLDNSFESISPVGRTSLVTAFDGTGGGTLFSGATGEVPLDWRLYYANPADGVGGTINPDGSYSIRTGIEAGASENRALFRSGNITVDPAKTYFFAVDLSMVDTNKIVSLSISMGGTTGGPIQSTFRFNVPMNGGSETVLYENNTIATLPLNFGTATSVTVLVNVTCDPLEQVDFTINNPRLYEV